jgi:O-acetyl-ADP-ribose deacetylase (regulator of RNase III)
MIKPTLGNLLLAPVDALVNTVNCVGVMGKGLALQFKQAYPAMFHAYEQAAKAGKLVPGTMFVYPTGNLVGPTYIINFPTKRHWKGGSRIEDIDAGLLDLVAQVQQLGLRSIAIPPLGAGNGGLDWALVRPRIVAAFETLPEVEVLLYEPQDAPAPEARVIRTERPALTVARALFLRLMDLYRIPDYAMTLLEVQKLAYFLQVAGEPLRLQFVKAPYGPYADNLNQVLRRLEGHYLFGATDTSPDTVLKLAPGAVAEAESFLEAHPEAGQRLERVARLIEGFETPYGLELLSTVHWVVQADARAAQDDGACILAVQGWSERKARLMQVEHIRVALGRLREEGFVAQVRSKSSDQEV